MKINNLNQIIKINIVAILFVSAFNFSFAQNEITTKEETFVSKILNIFKSEEKTEKRSEEIKTQEDKKEVPENDNKVDAKTEIKKEETKSEKIEKDKLEKREILCENKIKINTKKDKISKQIKNQISDKNKLIDTLLLVSASSTEINKNLLDEKILKLDSEVADIIKSQKELLNTLNSTSSNNCSQNIKNNLKIKDLEKNIDLKAENVNKIIKVEIKEVLKSTE